MPSARAVGIIDYGMGNLLSVRNALEMLGAHPQICAEPEALAGCERFILPGVGAFDAAMQGLKAKGFDQALHALVLGEGRPILGVCLGMQVMARGSTEGGTHSGLGWLDADVVRLQPSDQQLRVPQIGWNEVTARESSPLFVGVQRDDFYFVHSYELKCRNDEDVEALCDYGGSVVASVRRGPVAATQFHPEKSQDVGLRLLQNFLQWRP